MANPFVGPKPFGRNDIIYGRDAEISELRYFLGAKRIVVLYSPSGAGKSSLVQAKNGLITKLGATERFDVWGTARVNLAPDPAVPVANRFVWSAINGFERTYPAGARSAAEFASTTLRQYVTSRPAAASPVLIFDQFEEVLRTDPANSAAKREFFTQLGELLYEPTVWALFVLREDWLAALQPYLRQVPTHLQHRFRMDFLRREDQAVDAMTKPLEAQRRHFANNQIVPDLLANLAKVKADGQEVVGDTVEPLQLQVVCQNLWTTISNRDASLPITAKDIGDPSDALAKYYCHQVESRYVDKERTQLERRSLDEERQIRDWFDDDLIEDGVRKLVLSDRKRGVVGSLPAEIAAEIEDSYLVRKESRAGSTFYELSHDRLVEPITKSNREWRAKNLSTLQKAADLWEDRERSPDLLLRGDALSEAREWADSHILEPQEAEFLKQSNTEEEKRRLARNGRYLITALGLVAIGLGTWAWNSKREADRSRDEANASSAIADGARKDAERAKGRALTAEERARLALVQADLTQVARLNDGGKVNEALAYLARALKTDPHPQAVLTRSWAAGLLGRGNHRLPQREFAADGPVARIAYGTDRIATAQASTVQLWTLSGKPLGKPIDIGYRVREVSLGPAGMMITLPVPDAVDPKTKAPHAASLWTQQHGRWVEQRLEAPGPAPATEARFTPNLAEIIILADGALHVWKTNAAKPGTSTPLKLNVDAQAIQGFTMSVDGRWVAARCVNGAFVWNRQSGARIGPIGDKELTFVRLSFNGEQILGANGSELRVWNLPKVEPESDLPTFTAPPQVVLSLAQPVKDAWIGAHGELTTVSNGFVETWDVAAADKPKRRIAKVDEKDGFWRSSPDGRTILIASRQVLTLWDLRTGDQIARMQHGGQIRQAAFSRDGRTLLAGSDDRLALLWSVGRKEAQSRQILVREGVRHLAFGPRDQLAVATSNGVRILDLSQDPATPLSPDLSTAGPVYQVGFHADSLHATFWNPSRARWEVNLWKGTTRLNQASPWHLGRITLVALNKDHTLLFTGSQDRGRLWNAKTGEPVGAEMWHGGAPVLAAFFGEELLTAGGRNLFYWSTKDGRQRRHVPFSETIADAALDPGGQRLLIGFGQPDGRLRLQLHDGKGKLLHNLVRHNNGVFRVAVSEDRALSASADGADGGQFWSLGKAGPRTVGAPLQHTDQITAAAFNTDGGFALTASKDRSAQVWDPGTGLALGQPLLHAGEVVHAAFGRSYIATSSDYGHVQIWNFKAGAEADPRARADLAELAQIIGGEELSNDSVVTRLTLEQRKDRLRKLHEAKRASPDIDLMIERLANRSGLW